MFFTLIALVAMTLAALAMVRSVDTGNLVAGNISLKQGAVQEADKIMNTAFTCLDTGGALLALPAMLQSNQGTCNYFASLQADTLRPYGMPDILEATAGTTDPTTGNTRAYVIERLCNAVGPWTEATCMESPFGKPAAYGDVRTIKPLTPVQAMYRISVKVTGPRNVVSYSQMVMNSGI